MKLTTEMLAISTLGERRIRSPLRLSNVPGDGVGDFVPDEARIRCQVDVLAGQPAEEPALFEKAGPREQIFFDPDKTRAAIVTCGGLCPGLNNVIRSIFLELFHNYGVLDIRGIRFGYRGLNPAHNVAPLPLTPAVVENVHKEGGTFLGSSRGPEDPAVMVDFLEREAINLLFAIGGDGTQRGAHAIAEEVRRRAAPISVVGLPKTIDNDIMYAAKSFGFSTALEKSREVIDCAHMEAKGTPNGVGLVKLMGRDAGFIAAGATIASQEVNFALIPEVPFELEGAGNLLEALKARLDARGHAVVVVAEGAGQHLFDASQPVETDASGNPKQRDIGGLLKDRIGEYLKQAGLPFSVKYIDPSYIIRSVPANSDDSLLCDALARNAVHAAMAGKTDLMIGLMHDAFIHVPIPIAVAEKKRVSPEGDLWVSVLASTGQPHWQKRPEGIGRGAPAGSQAR